MHLCCHRKGARIEIRIFNLCTLKHLLRCAGKCLVVGNVLISVLDPGLSEPICRSANWPDVLAIPK